MTTRRGGDDPILLSLRQADCTLARATRTGGPARWRSSLNERRGGDDIDIAEIERAVDQIQSVQALADDRVRRVVTEALTTNGCQNVRTIREIAIAARVPRSSVQRLLRQGLDALRKEFDRRDAA